eukprot:CAMPEP_0171452390 /NCGR_PEP_ID=MMETSP0945-20130129/517_1 /TAXON_ID=109269 /ORGANISM="Vaucheria litorea, Strain CCMP2940" /LENGTH=156 /DNA_ID=CAMNT_0011977047 /DNA_START=120 /DNA_END=590 /DNA_ORIENTATION=-
MSVGNGTNSAKFSALNAREELEAVVRLDTIEGDENFMSAAMKELMVKGGCAFVKVRGIGPNSQSTMARNSKGVSNSVRQRNRASSEGSLLSEEIDSSAASKDPIQIFGGLVPPALRKAKRSFTSALDYAILAATLSQKALLLLGEYERCLKSRNRL